MRNALLAATALVAVSAPAFAADLPSRTMAPAAPIATTYLPVFTWTGFYVGVNAGYGWTNSENVSVTPIGGGIATLFSTSDDGGFTGGGQIGYNMQWGAWVLGLETDINYADFGANSPYAIDELNFRTDHGNYFGTIRARAGYAIDRTLLYVTGGLAYGDVGESLSGSDVNWGWTLGAGVEYAFTNNWTAKLEGLYVRLDRGSSTVTLSDPLGAEVGVARLSGNNEFGVVRAGLNYKF